MLLQVTNDCSLLPLLVQVVEVAGGLIAILMQQDPIPQGICGSLLLAMLQESCRRMAQLIQGMLTAWSCYIGRASFAGSYPEHPELPCTLGVEGEAIASCHILNVHLELVPPRCSAESCGHWTSVKEGLNLSCNEGFEGRVGNDGASFWPFFR